MSEAIAISIADYKDTYRLILERIEGLTDVQLSWKPAPERWSVKQIVAHLVDSSLVHAIRIRKNVAESNPPFLVYDQDAWVDSSRANETSITDILHAFESIVRYNALFFGRLAEADWSRTGVNQDKEVSVADLFHGFIRHVNIHLAQIDRTKAAFPAALQV